MDFCEDDRKRFLEICKEENCKTKEYDGIGTYKERIIHTVFKEYFCPNSDNHEIKVGRFVADAFDGENIYEVQTSSFFLLKNKLKYYLEKTNFDIYVIHPIATVKYLAFADKDTKELLKNPRKSPKKKKELSILSELNGVSEFFGNEKLHFLFPLIEVIEIRLNDGYGKDKKKKATLYSKVPSDIFSILKINKVEDLEEFLSSYLSKKEYSISELKKELSLNGLKYWSAEKFLIECGIITKIKDETNGKNRVKIIKKSP